MARPSRSGQGGHLGDGESVVWGKAGIIRPQPRREGIGFYAAGFTVTHPGVRERPRRAALTTSFGNDDNKVLYQRCKRMIEVTFDPAIQGLNVAIYGEKCPFCLIKGVFGL